MIKRITRKINDFVNAKQPICVYNVFNKFYDKKVLVSYITSPFTVGLSDIHTNFTECYTACQIFDELGYKVDVIDYDKYEDTIDFKSYSVVYGFGESLERLFYHKEYSVFSKELKLIVYGTGCDTAFSNKISLERVNNFYKFTNLLCITSARLAPFSWRCQVVFADLVIALGNQFVADTYLLYNVNRVEHIKVFLKKVFAIDTHQKDFPSAKQNFIWWGSAGAIHKGLDLTIQVFSKRKDINLFICGYRSEYPFCNFFDSVIAKSENIFDLGFIDVGSEKHLELMNNCVATIMPSASEGGAPGIVNSCGNAGLIPILTKNCGVDLPEIAKQFVLDELSADDIEKKIDLVLSLDVASIKEISERIQYYFQDNHSFAKYKARLKELIISAL